MFMWSMVIFLAGCDMYGYGTVGGDFSGNQSAFPPMLNDSWYAWDANTGKKYESVTFGSAEKLPYTYFDHYHLKDAYAVKSTDYYYFLDDYRAGEWARRKVAIVRQAVLFNGNAGVLIFEWFDTREPNLGFYMERPFWAMYFRIINQNAVQFAEAKNSVTNVRTTKATYEEAAASFTMGNEGDYVDWAYVPVYQRETGEEIEE
jgi:hypothetical protein